MLYLYTKDSCPYSRRVLKANETINAPLIIKDIYAVGANLTELIEKGGKRQVPFLHDTKREVAMYESLDIIEYLARHYGGGVVPETENPGNVCPID